MNDDWLVSIMMDIRAYAIQENCIGLVPYIDATFEAAREELTPTSERAIMALYGTEIPGPIHGSRPVAPAGHGLRPFESRRAVPN